MIRYQKTVVMSGNIGVIPYITLSICRPYVDMAMTERLKREIHIFSDASKDAIAAVAYVKVKDVNTTRRIGFILGEKQRWLRNTGTLYHD